MFMNVIWADEAMSHLPTKDTHVAHAHQGGHLCCYVWLANWFDVLWFHLVHVYSQIRFNYAFHATIGIQACSRHMMYNKWCFPNEVIDVTCVSHVEANMSVWLSCLKSLGQNPDKSCVWDVWVSGMKHGFWSWFYIWLWYFHMGEWKVCLFF